MLGLGEVIQKRSRSVEKKDVSIKKFSEDSIMLNCGFKTFDLNVMADLDEVSKKKVLVELIAKQWQSEEKKFVNLHNVYSDPRVLAFAYAGVIKARVGHMVRGCALVFEDINPDAIKSLSFGLNNGT
jgi:hypothetical protein